MSSQILAHARRIALGGTSGITGFAAYKCQTDPVHIFWDLDHTILCSITPIPTNFNDQNDRSNHNTQTSKCPVSPSNLLSSLPSPPSLRYFNQIDDDFPYDDQTLSPNVRTYFRPGALMALQLCSYFGVLHIYTAAQESYTNNILHELDPDRRIFTKVLHRTEFPQIVKEGKDLNVGTDDMQRAILFDDRLYNFKPQKYENGIIVKPFTSDEVEKCYNGSWSAYLKEVKEMSRLVGIAFCSSVHFSGDVRNVVSW
eukprot:CAMPEP_0172324970 /NCGR_PEP_ID=MMETSP1058-20130122/52777_1 /TAXON_ID=83371 /ORGANISM="Detonula confervacea, Strain CCMP 353" /LENGTH=254 /DNA_ID=CAMNT_0013041399 /DNA_START=151 /DNA_END=912 /DNA_ORIENTATION=+